MRKIKSVFLALGFLLSLAGNAAVVGKIQNVDIKSLADIQASGATITGNLTSSNVCITSPSSLTGVFAHEFIYDSTTSSNIPAATTVIAVPGSCSAGQIQMSAGAAGSATGDTLTFGGQMSQLPNDTKVYVTANGLNEQLSTAITNGSFAGAANSSLLVGNLGVTAATGANALTINLTTATGSTPTGGNPVILNFRNSTSATGQYAAINVTSALSIVVPSGATLGQRSAISEYIYLYAQNNSGTAELCVTTNGLFDEGSTVTSTTISSGATSRGTLYCTTGATGPVRKIVRLQSTQATAGTWATNPSEISVSPFLNPPFYISGTQTWKHFIYGVTANCSSSPCGSVFQEGGGLTNITRGGNGQYTANFTSSFWGSAPFCLCSAWDSNGDSAICSPQAMASTSTFAIYTDNRLGTLTDESFIVYCSGPQ